jgi:methyl-accepting chemotaxis protein
VYDVPSSLRIAGRVSSAPFRVAPPGPRSLAYRLRGWADDAAALEQRLKDLETFNRAGRRRWLLVGGVFTAGMVGVVAGAAATPSGHMALAAIVAALLNGAIGSLHNHGWYRWWLIYALALLDVAIAASLIVWLGPGGLVVALLLAVLPYTFDQDKTVGDFLLLVAALTYPAAAHAHHAWYGGPGITTATWLETLALMAVAAVLKRIPAHLLERVRRTRAVMAEAEQGFLAARAPAAEADELGFLERSLNRMLDELGATISAVQREADEVAAFAEELAASAEQLHATSESVTDTARELAGGLGDQRALAETSRSESAKAADQAETLRTRAELMQTDATRLADAAARGRDRVERASQTLRGIADEVRATGATVSSLAGMSERIGAFAQTIGRIARQTHLLALNAAIEAARAEERGEGFAVVADEVRALAGEAARSAREVAELVGDLRIGIDSAVRAMQSGEGKVRDVGVVAGEAEGALRELQQGVQLVGDLVNATADVSRSQAQRLAELARSLERVAAISTTSAERAAGAASATGAQIASMGDLTATSQQLAQLAERLRASIARFSVLRRDQATAEHRAVRVAAD